MKCIRYLAVVGACLTALPAGWCCTLPWANCCLVAPTNFPTDASAETSATAGLKPSGGMSESGCPHCRAGKATTTASSPTDSTPTEKSTPVAPHHKCCEPFQGTVTTTNATTLMKLIEAEAFLMTPTALIDEVLPKFPGMNRSALADRRGDDSVPRHVLLCVWRC
jgi:hypothetical protein